jgi:hypothetical protein
MSKMRAWTNPVRLSWRRAAPSGDFLLLPAVFFTRGVCGGVEGYAPCFFVERRFLKTTHRTKQAAAMRRRTKNAFL